MKFKELVPDFVKTADDADRRMVKHLAKGLAWAVGMSICLNNMLKNQRAAGKCEAAGTISRMIGDMDLPEKEE